MCFLNNVISCLGVKVKGFCSHGATMTSWFLSSTMHKECVYIGLRKKCQPGFCKVLQSYNSCKKNCKYNYLSRITFLQINQELRFNTNSDQINRGPCFSTKYPEGFDLCYALPVHPDSSNKFLKTFQTKFWNGVQWRIIIDRITVMHCVPKGPDHWDDEGLQWLISLKQFIIHSLNYVHFCCYGLMKILLHVFFDLCSDMQDTISSYHLKTVLFHVLEDVHTDFWIPQNIFYCLRICLTRLLLFVMGGRCSKYFIP